MQSSVSAPLFTLPILPDEHDRMFRLFGQRREIDERKERLRNPIPFRDGERLTRYGILEGNELRFKIRDQSTDEGDTPDDLLAFLRDVYYYARYNHLLHSYTYNIYMCTLR